MGRAGGGEGAEEGEKNNLRTSWKKRRGIWEREAQYSVLTLDSCYRQLLLIFRLPEQYTVP